MKNYRVETKDVFFGLRILLTLTILTIATPAKAQEPIAGWDGGFYIRSADGNFEFRPLGILHVDFRGIENQRQINTDDTAASGFDIRRLRLGFEGFLIKDIGYALEVNFDEDTTELIFAYANFGFVPWAQFRVGQFKEPFSYEVLYPEKYLDFVERSNIAASVSPAEDIGVMIHNLGNPVAGYVEYGIGVFNGEGIHKPDIANNDMEFAGRFAVLPLAWGPSFLAKTKLAANATYSNEQHREFGLRPRTAEGFEFFPRLPVDGYRLRLGGDVQWFFGPASIKGAYIRAEEERGNDLPSLVTDGWHVDVTSLVTRQEKTLKMKKGWELVARYEVIRTDAEGRFELSGLQDDSGDLIHLTDNRVRSATFGLNTYYIYNIKTQINYQVSLYENEYLTPTSRTGEVELEAVEEPAHKVFARLQLFF